MDCGHEDRRILEFDHLRDKICCVTELFVDPRWESIQAELDKCELVCPNCHAVRTLERRSGPGNTPKQDGDPPTYLG